MLLLGIETSCDETAVAALSLHDQLAEIHGELVSSQVDLHMLYGGVVPELASREHLRHLPLLYQRLLEQTKLKLSDFSAIAVTQGPGLKGCLLIGLGFARGLALGAELPLIGVNHIEAHILSALLDNRELDFPYLCLVVSGGHTELLIVNAIGKYTLLARTNDDAAGEAFDKSANLLGLSYPGGAKLANLADSVSSSGFKLPRVMAGQSGFSFSGLKTAVAQEIRRNPGIFNDGQALAEMAHAIQETIVDHLVSNVTAAIQQTKIKKLAIVGGVSANQRLRTRCSALDVEAYFPKQNHTTDNAAMIAYAGLRRFSINDRRQFSEPKVLSRWPVEEI